MSDRKLTTGTNPISCFFPCKLPHCSSLNVIYRVTIGYRDNTNLYPVFTDPLKEVITALHVYITKDVSNIAYGTENGNIKLLISTSEKDPVALTEYDEDEIPEEPVIQGNYRCITVLNDHLCPITELLWISDLVISICKDGHVKCYQNGIAVSTFSVSENAILDCGKWGIALCELDHNKIKLILDFLKPTAISTFKNAIDDSDITHVAVANGQNFTFLVTGHASGSLQAWNLSLAKKNLNSF